MRQSMKNEAKVGSHNGREEAPDGNKRVLKQKHRDESRESEHDSR